MSKPSFALLWIFLATCLLTFANAAVFQRAVNYPVGSEPTSVAVGDFNEDGNLDLAVANSNNHVGGTASVSILLGNGDGTFGAATNFRAGPQPNALAAGDFNRDHHLDLAVSLDNDVHRRMMILFGDGTGNFGRPAQYPASEGTESVVVGDLNGDGNVDVVLGVDFIFQARVSVLLSNGNGTFEATKSYNPQPNGNTHQARLYDFDGDGILDILLANSGHAHSQGGIAILLGKGDGTFARYASLRDGKEPVAVAFVDINPGDGTNAHPDLIAADVKGNSVAVRLGNIDGSYQATKPFPTGSLPLDLIVDFIDRDGNRDAITVNSGSNDISFLHGNGDGTFSGPLNFRVGLSPHGMAEADFNGDGLPDLAVADTGSNEVSILLNGS